MKIYKLKSKYGWRGDGGLGEKLIQQIVDGVKTATNCPKIFYAKKELLELYDQIGKRITVIDKNNKPRCNIKMLDVFETFYGNPDPRLVSGEGYGKDIRKFKTCHAHVWDDLFAKAGCSLRDDTVLIAEIFELAQ